MSTTGTTGARVSGWWD